MRKYQIFSSLSFHFDFQESLIDEVQKDNENFVAESGGQGSAREDKLKQIAAAHDAFFELKGNLTEGTKFYNDLTQLLVTFQNKVRLKSGTGAMNIKN